MLELRLIKLHPNVWMKSLQFLDQLVKINYISEKWSIEASGGDGMQYDFVSECNSSLMCTCGAQIYELNQFRRSRRASIAGALRATKHQSTTGIRRRFCTSD